MIGKSIAVVFLTILPLTLVYADSFTINVPNGQGGYTSITLKQSGSGYTGPQGEFYAQFPSVHQLQAVYNTGASAAAPVTGPTVIEVPPPALPVYEQPPVPASGYMWVPGYWAYDPSVDDYYWVPGTWIEPPYAGLLWTPGYWHWRDGCYIFSQGYWGPHIGFYGGINYGHGYSGVGFSLPHVHGGGHYSGGASFNGGPGGITAAPTAVEQAAGHEHHFPPTVVQKSHIRAARKNLSLRASANHGRPAIAATAQAGVFKGHGAVAAKPGGAFYNKTHPHPPAHHKPAKTSHPKPKPKLDQST